MAGAATLYAVMAGVRLSDKASCTSEPCHWLAPLSRIIIFLTQFRFHLQQIKHQFFKTKWSTIFGN